MTFLLAIASTTMSLKVKSVQYDDVHLSTYHDVDVFSEELRVLIASGYTVSLEITAHYNVLPDYGIFKPSQSTNRKKFECEHGAFNSHQSNTTITKNDPDVWWSYTLMEWAMEDADFGGTSYIYI